MKKFAGQKGEFNSWVQGIIDNLNLKAGHFAHFSTARLNKLERKIIWEIYENYKTQLSTGRLVDTIWEDSCYEVELVILEAHEIDIPDFLHWELVNYYLGSNDYKF